MRSRAPALAIALAVSMLPAGSRAEPLDANWTETKYATDLTYITGLAWAPDETNRLFVSRLAGEIRIVRDGVVLPTPFATVSPVYVVVECGLIGIALDPDFVVNHYVYVRACVSGTEQQIIRYTAAGDVGVDPTVLVGGLPTAGGTHNGGAVGVGPDGHIYWGIGDNGGIGWGPDLMLLAAKIGRARRDGSVPDDNPFVDGAGPNADYIWARGFRNPYTFTFQPGTGQLWVNVVGANYEQVFVVGRGDHGGWLDYENNQPAGYIRPVIAYRTNGVDSPAIASAQRIGGIATYTTATPHRFQLGARITVAGSANPSFDGSSYVLAIPSDTTFEMSQPLGDAASTGGTATTLAQGGCITGGVFYNSTAADPAYWGNFFYGDYNSMRVMRATLDETNTVATVDHFSLQTERMIDVESGPDGALYYGTLIGTIIRSAFRASTQRIVVSRRFFDAMEGGRSIVMVSLARRPAADVTVAAARTSGDEDVTVESGAELVFTSETWSTPQPVMLAIAEDGDIARDAATIAVSSSGLATIDVGVNVIDDDVAPQPELAVSRSDVEIAEGGTATFDVRLTLAPSAPIDVTVSASGDPDVGVMAGATLSIGPSDFDAPHPVTLEAASDVDLADDTATVSVGAPGLASRSVAVTVLDDDDDDAGPPPQPDAGAPDAGSDGGPPPPPSGGCGCGIAGSRSPSALLALLALLALRSRREQHEE